MRSHSISRTRWSRTGRPRPVRTVAEELARAPTARAKAVMVRVNPIDSGLFEADLDAVVAARARCDQPSEGRDCRGGPSALHPSRATRKTARSGTPHRRSGQYRDAAGSAGKLRKSPLSSDRIVGLQLGFGDLFEPFGIERSPATLTPVRLAVRLAAAEAGVPAYDGAFGGVSDLAAFELRRCCSGARLRRKELRSSDPDRDRQRGLSFRAPPRSRRRGASYRPRMRWRHAASVRLRWTASRRRPFIARARRYLLKIAERARDDV